MKRVLLASALLSGTFLGAQEGAPAVPAIPEVPDEQIILSLISNSPFGTSARGSVSEMVGVSLRSAVFVEGQWHFSLVSKDGKAAWLTLNEDNETFPCKITEFDQDNMSVKAVVGGKTYDLSMSDRASFANQKIELVAGVLPEARPRSIADRRARWNHASDAQKLEVNNIYQRAQSEGRPVSRAERARIFEIERSIKVPENAASAGSATAPEARQPRGGTR